jgi:hypothetical protein
MSLPPFDPPFDLTTTPPTSVEAPAWDPARFVMSTSLSLVLAVVRAFRDTAPAVGIEVAKMVVELLKNVPPLGLASLTQGAWVGEVGVGGHE